MKVLHRRCAGLDVHKDSVVACARIASGNKVFQESRTFGTTVSELMALQAWLTEHGCTHVVMEATGVYWKPVWHVLEGSFELLLANAAHVKNVPGRKTDVKDAEWLSDLLAHGLVRSSFVPPPVIQELRDLTRTRKQLVREVVQHTQRIQKVLETANIKLTSVISDVLGRTGRAVLEALADGEADPNVLVALKHPRVKATDEEFVEALRGAATDHHRFLVRLHLDQIDALHAAIERLDAQLEVVLEPFRDHVRRLTTMPGISDTMAHAIVAEIGFDMSRFATAAHLISWAGLCPRNDESAGKRRSTRLRKSNVWLKSQLVQAAWAAVKKKDSYLRAQYWRLRARRGPKKAIVAVAASMLTAAYHILRDGVAYADLGADHFDRRNKAHNVKHLVRRLEGMGFAVTITPAA